MVALYPASPGVVSTAADEHHKAVFALIQSLYDTSPTNGDIESIEERFADLLDLMASLFASEEAMMCRIGHPDRVQHSQEHTSLLQVYGSYFYEKTSMLSVNRRTYLNDLTRRLTDHIREYDEPFFSFYRFVRTSLGACVASSVITGLGETCRFLHHS